MKRHTADRVVPDPSGPAPHRRVSPDPNATAVAKDAAPDSFYHPELDCLRFFAFFAVFLHHLFPQEPSGYHGLGATASTALASIVQAGGLGVDLFFCLSAFLITSLLLREDKARGKIDVKAFWIRRILRIWPLTYFFIVLAAVFVPMVLPDDRLRGFYLLAFVFLSGNLACVANGYPSSVAAPLWSVSIEEQFYLAWPLLLSILTVKRLPRMAAVCLVIASITRAAVALLDVPHPAVWCSTLARLDPIALGALFAVYTQRREYTLSKTARFLLALTGLIVPPALIFALGPSCWSGFSSLVFYPAVAVCCLLVLIAVFKSAAGSSVQKDKAGNHPGVRFLIYLGRISYGLYVFHVLAIHLAAKVPIFSTATSMSWKVANRISLCGLGFLVTLAMASASYFLLEMPFLRLKKRFTYIQSTPAPQTAPGNQV
jgi:peptidoglycan/LPS O-acetylase OafA/YrhL